MGKIRKSKTQVAILNNDKINFVTFKQRRLIEYKIDLVASDNVVYSAEIKDTQDAVVKVVIRYRVEDEKKAESILKETMERLQEIAYYVRQPQKVILREPARRIEGVKHTDKPLDAAKIWLEDRRPKNYVIEDILKRLNTYFESVVDPGKYDRVLPAPMSIRSFMVDNYMPFKGLHVVEGIEDGVIGIIAKYDEQSERSNRAGKSALLDSFFFTLQGEGRKLGDKKAIPTTKSMHDGTDYFETGLGLEIDNPITISRKVQKKVVGQKPVITFGDVVISASEAKSEITKLLGMDKTDFIKTCYVRQGDLIGMLEGASGQLKADIIRWKGLGIWSDAEDLIDKDQGVVDKKYRALEATREVYLKLVEEGPPDEAEIIKVKTEMKEIDEHNKKIDMAMERYENLRLKLGTAQVVEDSHKDIEKADGKDKRLEEVRKELSKAEKWNSEVAAADGKLAEIKSKLKTAIQVVEMNHIVAQEHKFKTDFDSADKARLEIDKALAEAKEEEGQARKTWRDCKVRADKGFDGVCPIDSESCPRTEKINSDAKAANERKAEANKELDKAVKKTREINTNQIRNRNELDAIKNSIQKCNQAREFVKENRDLTVSTFEKQFKEAQEVANRELRPTGPIQELIENLVVVIERAETAVKFIDSHPDIESVEKITRDLEKLRKEAEEKRLSTEDLQTRRADMMTKLGMYIQAEKSVKESEQEIIDLQKEASMLKYLRHLSGRRGVPSMMIESAMVEIVDGTNAILDDLGTDHRLEFEFERELQRLESHCSGCGDEFPETTKVKFCENCGAGRSRERADEMRPMVREGNRLQDFDQDSGAGRGLIALAIRIVLSRFMGATVLFLDEVTSDLDDYHLPIMIRLLTKLPEMGFRQVFVISHQKQIADAMPRNILVTRIPSESRSTVGWETDVENVIQAASIALDK